MKHRPRRVFELLLIVAMLILPFRDQTTSADATRDRALVKLLPEVRLRKLHLVRPDLIQYPIQFEVYC